VSATPDTAAPDPTLTSAVVVICTKDRPREVVPSCIAAHHASPQLPILVLDASTWGATQEACQTLARRLGPSLRLFYRRARQPGLARQRNEAVRMCREWSADIVHFIDDDTEVASGYFAAIERRFRQQPEVKGVGGVVENQPSPAHLAIKRMFLLESRKRGAALRSGRNTLGQYSDTHSGDRVDWLSGCSMSYRLAVFDEHLFDERLEGYSLGEDFDFSFRLGRGHRLAVEPAARCLHHLAPTARDSLRMRRRQGTVTLHRWVSENREAGMSLPAFWWSTFGDALLHTARSGLRRDREALEELRGTLEGVLDIRRARRSSADR
jgi:GT2 family glycosyltransferase